MSEYHINIEKASVDNAKTIKGIIIRVLTWPIILLVEKIGKLDFSYLGLSSRLLIGKNNALIDSYKKKKLVTL